MFVADAGADLDHALMHLRLDGFLELHLALGDDFGIDVRAKIARDRIDGLILFLDADGEAGRDGHLTGSSASACVHLGCGLSSSLSTANSATASTIQSKFSSPDRMQIRVRRRIQKIDGVRDAVFDRELDGVQIVAQRAAQLQAIAFDARGTWCGVDGRRVQHIAMRVRTARIVLHDVHLLLADHVAAEIIGRS